jgi:D-alanine transfer protein
MALAGMLALSVALGYHGTLPPQGLADAGYYYDILSDEEKMASPAFIASALHEDSVLVFGSSEFGAGAYQMAEHPSVFFREHNIGYSPMFVGGAHTQSLQHAINVGALAGQAPGNKVVLIVSPQWFAGTGVQPQAFRSRFSWEMYEAFLAQAGLSAELKQRVRVRLDELGVDPAHLDASAAAAPASLAAPSLAWPADILNSFVYGALDDLKAREGLQSVRQHGYTSGSQVMAEDTDPDWEGLRQQAARTASATCDNNRFGIENSYFNEYIGPDVASFAGADRAVSYLDSREYDDLRLFLDVCDEAGLESLVVIVPVNGAWYDHTGMSQDMRASYYNNIRTICAESATAYADLSGFEHERYFLRDVMHLGWLGWLAVEEAVHGFVNG